MKRNIDQLIKGFSKCSLYKKNLLGVGRYLVGPTSQMIFRTSRELIYDCREMCEPSLPDVAKVMDDLGFKSDQFCGQYTWILYEKEELRY